MTTETITLSSFLLARIAEDEAMARFAQSSGKWALAENIAVAIDNPTGYVLLDPARVLAECAAKRAIVEMFAADYDEHGLPWGAGGYGEAYCEALQHLAAVYSDHPEFREEWRP